MKQGCEGQRRSSVQSEEEKLCLHFSSSSRSPSSLRSDKEDAAFQIISYLMQFLVLKHEYKNAASVGEKQDDAVSVLFQFHQHLL